jgi:hypothetical protein
MTLPKIDVPVFEVKLPSDDRIIQCRPFLVKEEKILLLASESRDLGEIVQATLQVIMNCLVDAGHEGINIDRRPFFDIEYLFLVLRAKSVSENIDINYSCNNMVDDEPCNHIFEVKMDILNTRLRKTDGISEKIELSSTTGVKMKYPSYIDAKRSLESENDLDRKVGLIARSIDYIYEGETIYSRKDMTEEELGNFIDNLTSEQFEKMEEWVNNLPWLEIEEKRVCEKCKFEHTIRYDDFDSFFL